jgi:putative transcription factor
MSFQDWTPVVFKKEVKKPHIPQPTGNKAFKLLNENEVEAPKLIEFETRILIQKARIAKNMSQKDLAQKINIKANDIANYEAGTVIPDKNILRKIGKILEVKLC